MSHRPFKDRLYAEFATIGNALAVERSTVLTMREVRQQLERGEPLIVVDVRQAHEWAAGHIPQAALIEAGGQVQQGTPSDRQPAPA